VRELDKAPRVVEVRVIERERRQWRREVSKLEREIRDLRQRFENEKGIHGENSTGEAKYEEHDAVSDEVSHEEDDQEVIYDDEGNSASTTQNGTHTTTPTKNGNIASPLKKRHSVNSNNGITSPLSPRSYALQLREAKKMARDAMEQCSTTLKEQERESSMRVKKAEHEIEKLVEENMDQRERISVAEATMQSLMDEVIGLRENSSVSKEQNDQLAQKNSSLSDLNDRLTLRIQRAEETIDEFFQKYQNALRLLKQKDEDYASRVEEAQRLNRELEFATQQASDNLMQFHEKHGERIQEANETIQQFGEKNNESVKQLMESREDERHEAAEQVLGDHALDINQEMHRDVQEASELVEEQEEINQAEQNDDAPVLAQQEDEDIVDKTEQVAAVEDYYENELASREEQNTRLSKELNENEPQKDDIQQQEPVLADNVEQDNAIPAEPPVESDTAVAASPAFDSQDVDIDMHNNEYNDGDSANYDDDLDLDSYDPGSLPPLPQ